MADQLINSLNSGSISDSSLGLIGDPITGTLTQTGYHAMKDYFIAGITGSSGTINTGSFATTSSLNSFTASYIQDSGSFNNRINSLSGSIISVNTGSFLLSSSFNSYTSSANIQISNVFFSQSNYETTASFNTFSGSYIGFSGSYVRDSGSFLTLIASVSGSGGGVGIINFNSYTSSTNAQILNVYASESNYTTTASFNTVSSSFNTRINSITSSGGTTFSGSFPQLAINTTKSIVGNIITDYFNRTSIGGNYSSSFTSGSISLNGISASVSGGDGSFNNFIEYEYYIGSEQWNYAINTTIGIITSSSFGLGIGMQTTVVSSVNDIYAIFSMDSSSGNLGNIQLQAVLGTTFLSSSAISLNQGDNLTLSINRLHGTITGTILNNTSGSTVTASYTYSYSTNPGIPANNTSKPRLYVLGGNQSIYSFNITENVTRNTPVLVVGDSITAGYYSTGIPNRWSNVLFGSDYTKFQVSAGPSEQTIDIVNKFPEISLISPKYAMILIGTNNISAGAQTVQQFGVSYNAMLQLFLNSNIVPIVLSITPRNDFNVVPFNNIVSSSCYNNGVAFIDIFSPLTGSGTGISSSYDGGDGLHPNLSGHAKIASVISASVSGLLTFDSNYGFEVNQSSSYFNTPTNFGAPVTIGTGKINNALPLSDFSTNIPNTNWVQKVIAVTSSQYVSSNSSSIQNAGFNVSGNGRVGGTFTTIGLYNAFGGVTSPSGSNIIGGGKLNVAGTTTLANGLTVSVGNTVLANGIQFDTNTGPRISDITNTGLFYQSGNTVKQHNFINFSSTTGSLTTVYIGGSVTNTSASALHIQGSGNTEAMTVLGAGYTGIGLNFPTAYLHVTASSVSASSLRINSGSSPVSPNDGDIWYDGTNIKLRTSGSTNNFITAISASAPSNTGSAVLWAQVVYSGSIYKMPLFQ